MLSLRRVALRPLWRNHSGLYSTNRYGVIVVEPKSPTGGDLKALTQLFPNGEIWGFAPWLLKNTEAGKSIPGKAFEETFRERLIDYVGFLEKELKIAPPYRVEAGAVGLKGGRILIDQFPDTPLGPIYDEGFQIERALNETSSAAVDRLVLEIFEGLFQVSGYPRPNGLFGFPPIE